MIILRPIKDILYDRVSSDLYEVLRENEDTKGECSHIAKSAVNRQKVTEASEGLRLEPYRTR